MEVSVRHAVPYRMRDVLPVPPPADEQPVDLLFVTKR